MNKALEYRTTLTFSTERLYLAIYLHASKALKFLRCDNSGGGRIRFVFDDPDQRGDQVELEFEQGATIPATILFASQTYLRRKMSDALGNRRNGEYRNGNSY